MSLASPQVLAVIREDLERRAMRVRWGWLIEGAGISGDRARHLYCWAVVGGWYWHPVSEPRLLLSVHGAADAMVEQIGRAAHTATWLSMPTHESDGIKVWH